MQRSTVWWATIAAAFLSSAAWGSGNSGVGVSAIGFGATWVDPPLIGKAARLLFTMAGEYSGEGTARIRLPVGVALVSGDTLHHGRAMGASKEWIICVAPERPGDFEIRGYLSVVDDYAVNELDLVLPFRVEKDTIAVESSHLTRIETVRGGRRFRYGGRFLVPIDRPEEVTHAEIQSSGRRATGPTELEIMCERCKGGAQTVKMVAFVASDGRVVDAKPWSAGKGLSDDVVAAAKRAISGVQYSPARLRGKSFADWVVVDVHVRVGQ